MEFFWKTDWRGLFTPEMSLPEILIRGTLVYLTICVLMRVVLRRQAGKMAASDLLVITIVAGVCRNPLVRNAYSIPDGLLMVGVVLLWSFFLDWLCYYFPLIHGWFHRKPVRVIEDGRVIHDQLRRELITDSRLRSKLRCKGVKGPAEVAEAWLEGNGKLSVIKKQENQRGSAGTAPSDCEGNANGPPGHQAPASISALVEAARTLQETAARHRQQLAQQERGLEEIRELLAHVGLHLDQDSKG